MERQHGVRVNVVICLDAEMLNRIEGILRHALVGLIEQSISIRLVSNDPRIDALAFGPIQAIRHEPLTPLLRRGRLRRLAAALGSVEPDIIHAVSWRSFDVGVRLAEWFDAELIVHLTSVHDCEHAARLPREHIAHVIVVCEPLRQAATEQLKFPADRVTLIRPGLTVVSSLTSFAQANRKPTLLCTTPFERDSGIEQVIDAVHALRANGHDLLAFLMGAGRCEDELRRRVRERNLSASVTFAQPLPDRTAAMRGADIFIRPNNKAEFAFDALQAMANGLVVVTPPDPLNDHFQPGKTAYVCDARSAAGLAECIDGVLTDRDRARSLAEAALDYVREHHSMSEMAEQTASLYRGLALPRATFPVGERAK